MIKVVDMHTKEKHRNIFTKHIGLETDNSSALIDFFIKSRKTNERIAIYDVTKNEFYKKGEMIRIGDHINLTGNNPIIGNQQKLGVDFLALNNLYNTENTLKDVEVAFCSNSIFSFSKEYKNHCKHIAVLAIAARASGYSVIEGFLYNIYEKKQIDL
tara:strand:+ start:66 stop:536 length:471 start_codon:yes stop_codon:yes gene_type:complete